VTIGPFVMARMAASSIATRATVGWVTDFFNHAFYRLPLDQRRVEDLRLAHGILNTRWAMTGRRLGIRDRRPFHAAFGVRQLGVFRELDEAALLEGGAHLIGDWFPDAWRDPERRAYGIAFPTADARRAFDPSQRLRHAALRGLTPPRQPPGEQVWATYPPVHLPDPDAALALLRTPSRWPDIASAAGRFTAVRKGGLPGQTFEILLTIKPSPHTLAFTRGYVTCTAVETGGPGLERAVGAAEGEVQALPPEAEPIAFVELTTHQGHFMGRGVSRLIVFAKDGRAYVRDVGSWDPLPPHLALAYAAGGHSAQVAFWGADDVEGGMLAQLALVTA
jgi:hypothetical protein